MAAPLLGKTRGFYYDLCDLTMQSALGAVDLSFVEIHGMSESTACKRWWTSRRAEKKKERIVVTTVTTKIMAAKIYSLLCSRH